MSRYYRTCPTCGAHLDPGEICEDCREKENAAQGAANTPDGMTESKASKSSNPIAIVAGMKGKCKNEI